MSTSEADVVIIGAGISGLTAAYHIHKTDPSLRVIVLEAKDRVGGRTLSLELKTGSGTDKWDLGGQWVGRCQPHIMGLLKELGLETHRQYITGRKFMQLGSDQISSYESVIPSLSFLALIDMQMLISRLNRMSRQIDMHDPYLCPYAKEWDSQTVASFLEKHVWTRGAQETMEAACRCTFGTEVTQMSLLYLVMYIRGAINMDCLIEATDGTAQESKVVGGTQQISEKMAATLDSNSVLLNHPVTSIQQTENNVSVITADGSIYKCQRVIVATPPNMTGKIQFDPMLPTEKREILKRMPISNLTKIIITYEKAFWREAGLSGEIVTNGGPSSTSSCDRGPLCIGFDATSANGNPALVTFIGGEAAVQWQTQEYTERRSAVLKSLSDFFGNKCWDYVDYKEQDWGLEPYIEGGPVCSVAPGAMQYFAKGLRKPFNRLHFAGTESAMEWCGYMSGAVEAGLRTATEVLHHLRPQSLSSEMSNRYGSAYSLSNGNVIFQHPRKKSSKVKTLVKVTVGLGALVVIGYGAKKMYERIQS